MRHVRNKLEDNGGHGQDIDVRCVRVHVRGYGCVGADVNEGIHVDVDVDEGGGGGRARRRER